MQLTFTDVTYRHVECLRLYSIWITHICYCYINSQVVINTIVLSRRRSWSPAMHIYSKCMAPRTIYTAIIFYAVGGSPDQIWLPQMVRLCRSGPPAFSVLYNSDF